MISQCIKFNIDEFIPQLSRYCSVGAVATFLHYCVFIILLSFTDAVFASFIGVSLGTVVAYLGHRSFTFLSTSINELQPKRFFIVAINYNIINITLMWIFLEIANLSPLVAQLIITVSLGFISFITHKYWSYKDRDVF